ncbi:MAG: hypothetical protein KIT09_23010 [Bryobacteraceae bacterium]|nr:hypothetical protein [Bryobacteraceae bacterium]
MKIVLKLGVVAFAILAIVYAVKTLNQPGRTQIHIADDREPDQPSPSPFPGSAPAAEPWSGADAPRPSPPANPSAAPGWVTHEDPNGFRVQHPSGWRIETAGARGVAVRDDRSGAFAVVRPVFASHRASALAWIRQSGWGDPGLMPGASLISATQLSRSPDQARGVATYQTRGGLGRAVILCVMFDGPGTLYGIGAPERDFDALKQDLVRIVQSFSFTAAQQSPGGQVAPGEPAISFTKFSDPRENAFTTAVPSGWQVNGGTMRLSATDVRHFVHAASPDGMTVAIGDADIPPFVLPNETMNWTGFTEGRWYQTMDGTKMMVRRFVPGLAFAREYAASTLARGAGGLELLDQRERPELAQSVNALSGGLAQTTLSFGEVSFKLSRDGVQTAGYCLAGTEMISMAGTGVWTVRHLYNFVAPEPKVALASSVLTRMIQSVEINPQWFAAQQGTTAAVSRIVTETNNHISRVQSQSYWNAQRSADRRSRQFSDTIRGVQRVQDPNTGQEYEAVAGSNYYWRAAGSDQPFGTDASDVPRYIDVTPLLIVE